jgi:hypothetical protein
MRCGGIQGVRIQEQGVRMQQQEQQINMPLHALLARSAPLSIGHKYFLLLMMLFENMLSFVFKTLTNMFLYDPRKFLFKPVSMRKKDKIMCHNTNPSGGLTRRNGRNILALLWCSV